MAIAVSTHTMLCPCAFVVIVGAHLHLSEIDYRCSCQRARRSR